MNHSDSIGQTVDSQANVLANRPFPWPAISDWVKLVLIAVFAGMIINLGINVPSLVSRAKQIGAQTIAEFLDPPADTTVIPPTEVAQSIHQEVSPCRTQSSKYSTVVIYRVVSGRDTGCH